MAIQIKLCNNRRGDHHSHLDNGPSIHIHCQQETQHERDDQWNQGCHYAQNHRTSTCPTENQPLKCTNCRSKKALGHGAADRDCPVFIAKTHKLHQRNPENKYKIFPTDDSDTWKLLANTNEHTTIATAPQCQAPSFNTTYQFKGDSYWPSVTVTFTFTFTYLFHILMTHSWLCIAAPFPYAFHFADSQRLHASFIQHVQPCRVLISITHLYLYKL